MHSSLSVHLATTGPGLYPGFDQANVSLPHCQTQLHQFKFPAQSPSSLPQVAAGWDRSSCSTRGERGASPLLKVGLILFLQGTLSSPNPALYQKFFQEIKGPSDSLLGIPVRPLSCLRVPPHGPSHRHILGQISKVG